MDERHRDENLNTGRKNLFYLDELDDYKVASEDPDVRGWEVKDANRRTIGRVDNLLVNPNSERVVYLDVEVDNSIIEADHDPYQNSAREGVHEFINSDGENHVIVPVGMARLDRENNCVLTNEITQDTFAKTNRFRKGEDIDRDYEIYVIDHYRGRDRNATSADRSDDSFYTGNEFDDRHFKG
ncbi:MAG TPA: photosystem reaction center subunit H [Salinimicrobium sp.]|nr:photosystem reaction center subunit H [Salinimicrobium sp.]